METLSFAFGMLAMTALFMIVLLVVGIVKVTRTDKKLSSFNRSFDDYVINIDRRWEERDRDVETQFRDVYEQLEKMSRDIFDRFNQVEMHIHEIEKKIYHDMHDNIKEVISSIDRLESKTFNTRSELGSRIEKLENGK